MPKMEFYPQFFKKGFYPLQIVVLLYMRISNSKRFLGLFGAEEQVLLSVYI
jgi:hypothetical protein